MKIPKSWSEVSISKFNELHEVLGLTFPNNEVKVLTILSALCDCSIEYLESKMDVTKLSKAIADITFISKPPVKVKPMPTIKVGGKRFVFDMILKDSLASSFIDLSEYAKNEKTAKENLHNVIAIFCYEVNWFGFKKKKTVQDTKRIAEFIKENMSIDVALGYTGFFLTSYHNLLRGTVTYSEKATKKAMKIAKKSLNL